MLVKGEYEFNHFGGVRCMRKYMHHGECSNRWPLSMRSRKLLRGRQRVSNFFCSQIRLAIRKHAAITSTAVPFHSLDSEL